MTADDRAASEIHQRDVDALRAIMAALRTPVTGCPWDLEQDFSTIAPYTIEEAYEVADAIARGDLSDLREELGDLLLQVVFHARMAEEQRIFDFDDVVHGICEKLIRRHPHVFGDAEARSAGAVKGLWEDIKAREKAGRDPGDSAHQASLTDGVPLPLPALVRAVKLQAKVVRAGFDWPGIEPVFDKVAEEIAELHAEIESGDRTGIFEEMGDLLFVMANLARHLGVDPEAALRATNERFVRRFKFVEHELRKAGKRPEDSDLEEMDRLWNRAKAAEKTAG